MKSDVKERLKFIELCLLLLGEFKKGYFQLLFDTQKAQHRKDLRAYEETSPGNMAYDTSLKRYVPTESFKAQLLPTDSNAFFAFQQYVEDLIKARGEVSPFHNVEYISQPFLSAPCIELWGALNRAITKKLVLRINYFGFRKNNQSYVIQPLALVHNGFRWHVRVYILEENRYRDFVLSRISRYDITETDYHQEGSIENDEDWNSIIELVFKPNPLLIDAERVQSVEIDYGMTNGKKVVQCRQCHVQHILKAARAGYSNEHRDPTLFPIVLDYENDKPLVKILDALKSKS